VVGTEEVSPEDLEQAVCHAYREWERHKLWRAVRDPKYFLKALSNPLRGFRHLAHIYRSYRPS
jgi:hypothetical protein